MDVGPISLQLGNYWSARMTRYFFSLLCPNLLLRRTRLVAVATQKFISDIASDSLQYVNPQCRNSYFYLNAIHLLV
jgi:hypothetical protein